MDGVVFHPSDVLPSFLRHLHFPPFSFSLFLIFLPRSTKHIFLHSHLPSWRQPGSDFFATLSSASSPPPSLNHTKFELVFLDLLASLGSFLKWFEFDGVALRSDSSLLH